MIQEIAHAGWQKNLRLSNDHAELIITLEVGPRVIHYSLPGGANVFGTNEKHLGGKGESKWMGRGGHRFWTGPEHAHSYAIDNDPVQYRELGPDIVEVIAAPNVEHGFQKTLRVQLKDSGEVVVDHILRNSGNAPLHVTPWALTVMAKHTLALLPQPPHKPHPGEFSPEPAFPIGDFLPDRHLVLWPFTSMADSRISWGDNLWTFRQIPGVPPIKLGTRYRLGWIHAQVDNVVFSKHVAHDPSATYPDGDVNFELYTDENILELETLAPLGPIPVERDRIHRELWRITACPEDLSVATAAREQFFARF